MKVLIIEPAGRGGIAQHAHNLANALAARGHGVALATAAGFETRSFSRRYEAVEAFDRFVPRPLLALAFFRFLKRFRPDVVHIEAAVHPGSYYIIWRAVRAVTAARFVYTAHDVASKKSRPYHPWVLRQIYRGMDRILVNAERNRQEIVDMFAGRADRIAFVPVGDLLAFVRDIPARPVRGVPDGSRTILFFGNIEPRKGLMNLIRAFAEVRREVPEAFLMVIGKPYEDIAPYRDEIQKLELGPRMLFRPGYAALEEISSILTATDVVALPYEQAWNSGIILSAYSYGKPVVSTDISGLSEVVKPGRTGLVVPAGRIPELAEALTRILKDEALRAAMGREALRVAEENSWAKIAERTEAVYAAALA